MWRNPKYQQADAGPASQGPATATPPEPRGTLLGAFRRTSRTGPESELRLVLDEYQGHRYIGVRVFERSRDGGWWPVKGKGCSIRLGEAEGVIGALAEALRIAGGADASDLAPRPRAGRPTGRPSAEKWRRDPTPRPPPPDGPPGDDPGY